MIVMPKRLADDVARRVRALIEEQKLEAGMRLPAERQLATQLGVSRNSLREALAMLVNEGVLLSRRGGGTFVRWQHEAWSEQNIVQPLKTLLSDDPDYSFDILEARHAIEASTAWHAAMRATDAEKEKIRLCFEATQSEDPDLASQADVRFHLAIAEASHNVVLLQTMRGFLTYYNPQSRRAASGCISSRRYSLASPNSTWRSWRRLSPVTRKVPDRR